MTEAQVSAEKQSSFFNGAPIYQPMSNSQIEKVLSWQEMMTADYK